MIKRSLSALAQALAAKEISSVELTQLYLDRIARLNPKINAYITVDAEKSLAQAGRPTICAPPARPDR
jgi:aspartyl-tRNA(Asn)/glutamyl-tRNA(Gln) amidotransferase subunit A